MKDMPASSIRVKLSFHCPRQVVRHILTHGHVQARAGRAHSPRSRPRSPCPFHRQSVGGIVAQICCVSLNPLEFRLHSELCSLIKLVYDTFYQIPIFHGLLGRGQPAIVPPSLKPHCCTLDCILAIAVDDYVSIPRGEVKGPLDGS